MAVSRASGVTPNFLAMPYHESLATTVYLLDPAGATVGLPAMVVVGTVAAGGAIVPPAGKAPPAGTTNWSPIFMKSFALNPFASRRACVVTPIACAIREGISPAFTTYFVPGGAGAADGVGEPGGAAVGGFELRVPVLPGASVATGAEVGTGGRVAKTVDAAAAGTVVPPLAFASVVEDAVDLLLPPPRPQPVRTEAARPSARRPAAERERRRLVIAKA